MKNHKLQYLTFGSLLANVLLLGLILGGYSHGLHVFGPPHQPPFKSMDEQIGKLPESIRGDVQNMMEKARRDNAPIMAELDRARDEAARILSADTFDEAAYQSIMDQIHSLHGQLKQHMVEDVKRMAKDLSQEQRAALAEILRRPPPFGGRDKSGPDGSAPPSPPPAPPQ